MQNLILSSIRTGKNISRHDRISIAAAHHILKTIDESILLNNLYCVIEQ